MHELQRLVRSVSSQLIIADLLRCLLPAISVYLIFNALDLNRIGILLAVFASLIAFAFTNVYQNKKQKAIALIHQYNNHAEYSLHLLEKENLNIAEQLQLERLAAALPEFPFLKIYRGMERYLVFLLASAAFYFIYPQIQSTSKVSKGIVSASVKKSGKEQLAPPSFQTAKVRILAPAYTQIPASESSDLNVKAIAGSQLNWWVQFDQSEHLSVRLANSRGEEVAFKLKNAAFEYTDKLAGSGLYSIKAYWKDSLVYQSDFYRLESVPDLGPKIEPASKELYKYHFLKDEKTLKVAARVSDDFRVSEAFIVATVARGAGENVKFREVRFPLSGNFKSADLAKSINLNELNFAPGDELYYYWAAIDNRQPEPNFTKSDTYFLVYKDTAQIEESQLATMAVNLVPEYFRSQRQIIIDTEKLIARRKKLDKKEFNSVSNEIGFDQKVLRLRYGQYLGEEFETNIGGDGQHDEGNIVDAFTHHSDGSGEGAEQRSAELPASQPEHDHDHGSGNKTEESKDPLAALMEQYTHAHDDAETNTFYEQSTRSLLKMALEQMWQSELHLRMYEPEKALPFENKALEYLKTAQQKARTYVKKSGYDPPPIREQEKRLTGEMKDISSDLSSEKTFTGKRTQQLATEMLGYLEISGFDKKQQAQVRQLAGTLNGRLMNSGPFNGGMQNWPVLTALQKLASGRAISPAENQNLKAALYKYAGKSQQSGPAYSSEKKLEAAFRRRLR